MLELGSGLALVFWCVFYSRQMLACHWSATVVCCHCPLIRSLLHLQQNRVLLNLQKAEYLIANQFGRSLKLARCMAGVLVVTAASRLRFSHCLTVISRIPVSGHPWRPKITRDVKFWHARRPMNAENRIAQHHWLPKKLPSWRPGSCLFKHTYVARIGQHSILILSCVLLSMFLITVRMLV